MELVRSEKESPSLSPWNIIRSKRNAARSTWRVELTQFSVTESESHRLTGYTINRMFQQRESDDYPPVKEQFHVEIQP